MNGTELGSAQAETIRTQVLKIGAQVRVTFRRIRVRLSTAHPLQRIFETILRHLHMNLPPPQRAQKVVTQAGSADDGRENGERNDALVTAIAKAYRWQEQLESHEYSGLEDLAAANGVDRTYVGRILRLTSLAPEIVEAILDGNEPEGISLARLRNDLPIVWGEQVWAGDSPCDA